MIDGGYELRSTHLAMAKLHVAESTGSIVNTAIQMFGGYGMLADYEVERMYRDLRILHVAGGTSEIMKMLISRSIFEQKS
mmetsp:Transcript_32611/g.5905  ORF Transcript_32611/g.5905 Transcript_32611/m.5905 type:complete len:80 (+) Transcript_32611:28-267(+)